jgi:hypothetical protein
MLLVSNDLFDYIMITASSIGIINISCTSMVVQNINGVVVVSEHLKRR